eukprot:IDg5007t1
MEVDVLNERAGYRAVHRCQRLRRTVCKATLRQASTVQGKYRARRTTPEADKAHDADTASPPTIEMGATLEDSGTISTRPPLPDLQSSSEGLLKAECP